MNSHPIGPRRVEYRYGDPLDQIWSSCAARIGLRVVRTPAAYASSDGRGQLAIGTPETLDADDCLAQMIFHELCHSLVEGEDSFTRPDWGLDSTGDGDVDREHACLRLQALLARRWGLGTVLAPTTEFRSFYDRLGPDPLVPRGSRSSVLAVLAARRAECPPWAPHLGEALAATAEVGRSTARFAPAAALLAQVAPPAPAHPSGLPGAHREALSCGSCAWFYRGGPGRAVERCRQAGDVRVAPTWPACERHEPALDCQHCGACCRAAYDSVQLSRREPLVRSHPALVVDRGSYIELAREGERCAALQVAPVDTAIADTAIAGAANDPSQLAPAAAAAPERSSGAPARAGPHAYHYACAVYEQRPRTCREFARGGAHCLTARRRVGLSL
jgi:hypothetical protein